MIFTRRSFIGSFVVTPLGASVVFAGGAPVFAPEGLALGGFDPLAYFEHGQAKQGHKRHRLLWHNAVWQFAPQTNMDRFEHNPRAFAPRYGGYCAMSLTQGRLSASVPDAWVIHDGYLYLTHSVASRDRWQRAPDRFIQMANAAWPMALCPDVAG